MEEEIWKDIPEFDGAYQISNYGRLRSLPRTAKHPKGICHLSGKILSEVEDKKGYIEYQITYNGRHYSRKAHRLVAEAFIPNPDNLPQINHKDTNKKNNNVENLEWCDNRWNVLHAYKNGLNKKVKKINQYAMDGKFIKTWRSTGDIERELGFSRSNIHSACRGNLKTYKGFIWRYEESEVM